MYGGVLLRFNGENEATAVRYVQQIKGDEAMEKRGLFEPGRVFVQKGGGKIRGGEKGGWAEREQIAHRSRGEGASETSSREGV